MPKSLLEQLPEIVANGRKQAERILESLENRQRVRLQTREVVLPAKDSAAQDWVTQQQRRIAQQEVFAPGQASLLPSAQATLDAVLVKARFWQRWAGMSLNERQVKLLNRLLDDFEGKLTSSKWASIAKCSPDTALRDITKLLELGVLNKSPGGGRSTGYELADQ